ncbi:MYXO-CTERM sorting domain-containing protein [Aeromonas allosaccharophila]
MNFSLSGCYLSAWLGLAWLGLAWRRRRQAELHLLLGTTATQYSRNFSPQRSQIRCFTWVA